MLRSQSQSRSQTRNNQPSNRRRLAVPIEPIHRSEEEARNSNIGSNERTMSQHIRLKHQHHQRNKRSTNTEHLVRSQKHQQAQHDRQNPVARRVLKVSILAYSGPFAKSISRPSIY